MLTANEIKAKVARYWRYERQCPMVAVEASCRLDAWNDGGQADVLAVTKDRYLIETEVKMSLADMRKDKNKPKHRSFRAADGIYPTHNFYFAVPYKLGAKACWVRNQLFPYAGILVFDEGSSGPVSIPYHATVLSTKKLGLLQLTRMAREMSASICRLLGEGW